MNLNQLHYFSVTARHQHFTRAAEELFISQPSLSYAISTLEEELGVKLFEKKGRNVSLTRQGALFLTHVERALSEIHQGREALQHMNNESENHLSIAAYSSYIGEHSLPDLMKRFSADLQDDELCFSFFQSDDDEMLSGIKSAKYDIAFLSSIPQAEAMTILPLSELPLYAIMPQNFPWISDAISLSELVRHPLIITENSPASRTLLNLFPESTISGRVRNRSAMLDLAAADFGIAVDYAAFGIEASGLRAVPVISPECHCTPCIAYKTNRDISSTMLNFLNFIQDQIIQ